MLRHVAALALLAVATLGISGCDRSQAKAPQPLEEVRIGYFANLTHAQAVLGVSSGEFAQAVAPAKLTTRVFNAGPSMVEAIFAGQIDIGYIGPGPALAAHTKSRGEGVRVIAGAAANGVLIVARKDSGIKSLADLAGRKLATPQLGNTQDISARHYVQSVLKQPTEMILPVPNAEQASLMSRGQIDAAWSPEPWGSRLLVEAGAVKLAHEKELWPDQQFTLTLVVTTPEFLAKHPDVVAKMLKVHCDWTRRLNDNPEQYVTQLDDALAQLTGKRLPPAVLPMAIKNVTFTNDPLDQTLLTMAQWSYDLKFSNQPAKLDGLVDLAILRNVAGGGEAKAGTQ